MKIRLLLFVLVLLVLQTLTVMAQESDVDILSSLFQADNSLIEGFFDQSFLKQVPTEKIIEILNIYKDKLGQLKDITGKSGNYTLVFVKGTAPARIVLNNV